MSTILQLKLVAFRGLAPAVSRMQEFDQDEILIGRAPDNDFVVEDPERYCSRYHARCYRADNQFFVEDTSTPGTQVNAGHFLNRGHRHRLVTGDLLHIGECQIQVELIEPAVAATPVEVGAFSIDDFFADGGAAEPEPAVNKVPLPNLPHTTSADFYSAMAPQSVEPEPAQAADIAGYVSAQSERMPAQDAFSDLHGDDHYVPDFPVPDVSPEEGGYAAPVVPEYAENPALNLAAQETAEIAGSVGDVVPPHQAPVEMVSGASHQAHPVVEATVAVQQSIPPQAVHQPVAPQVQPETAVDSRAIKAFLQGLDVQPSDLVGRNKEEIMFSAGQMLRVLTQGVMEILHSRNDVKKEFGMDVTRIGAQMNNPLKFSQNAGEAMVKLLTEAEGYMSAHDAVKEGVVDAKAHQIAVMAGMQSAIVSMLERFKPEALEEQLTTRFVFSRKGKYWETYKDAYQQLVAEAEDDFNALFGDEFSQVYQQQVREIESSYSQEQLK